MLFTTKAYREIQALNRRITELESINLTLDELMTSSELRAAQKAIKKKAK